MLINFDPEYLRSQRTLTAAQVDARTAAHDRFDLTPAERLDNATHRTLYGEAEH